MSLDVFPSNLRGLTYPVEKTSEFNTIVQPAPNLLETTVSQTRNPVWEWQLIYDVLFDDPTQVSPGTYTDYRRLQGFLLKMGGRATEFLYIDPTDNAVGPALISGVPNPMAELQLIDDGAGNYYSPIQRSFGGLFYEDITDLNGAIAVYANATLVAVTTDYTIIGPGLAIPGASFMGMVIFWNPPAPAWVAGHSYALNALILDPAGHIQKVTTAGTSGTLIPIFDDAGGTTPDGAGALVWTDQDYNPGPTGPVNAEFSFYFRAKFGEDKQDFTQFVNQMWTVGGSESSSGGTLTLRSSRPVQV
jgi:hypothetical protein